MKYACTLLLLLAFHVSKPSSSAIDVYDTVECLDQPTVENIHLLARLIYSEARGESYQGQLATAQVVVNRMIRRNKTLREVIYRPGQFDGIRTKAFYQSPSASCLQAARAVLLEGVRVFSQNVIYFHNPSTATDNQWTRSLEPYFCCKIGNHNFYYGK